MDALSAYRPNVGIVLFNHAGQVWLGRRAHTNGSHVWQFPQGGVDEGEDLFEAALRELEEETGVVSVSILGRTPGWITYDFPPNYAGSKAARAASRALSKVLECKVRVDEEGNAILQGRPSRAERRRPVALADVGRGADVSDRRYPKQVPGPSEAPKAWVPPPERSWPIWATGASLSRTGVRRAFHGRVFRRPRCSGPSSAWAWSPSACGWGCTTSRRRPSPPS